MFKNHYFLYGFWIHHPAPSDFHMILIVFRIILIFLFDFDGCYVTTDVRPKSSRVLFFWIAGFSGVSRHPRISQMPSFFFLFSLYCGSPRYLRIFNMRFFEYHVFSEYPGTLFHFFPEFQVAHRLKFSTYSSTLCVHRNHHDQA